MLSSRGRVAPVSNIQGWRLWFPDGAVLCLKGVAETLVCAHQVCFDGPEARHLLFERSCILVFAAAICSESGQTRRVR